MCAGVVIRTYESTYVHMGPYIPHMDLHLPLKL